MTKKCITVVLLLTVTGSLFAGNKAKTPKKTNEQPATATVLANTADSLSYAYGVGMGVSLAQNFKQIPAQINLDIFLEQFGKALKGDTTSLTILPNKAYEVFQTCMAKLQDQQSTANKEKAKEFLKKNAMEKGVCQTASGLQYQIIAEGTGEKPASTSTVSVNYEGKLLDGTVFDSSVKRGTPAQFPVDKVIKGWTEGLQLMSVGSKYRFWIPSDLAYGDNGAGGIIKPGELLVFDVELLKIVKEEPKEAVPAEEATSAKEVTPAKEGTPAKNATAAKKTAVKKVSATKKADSKK